VQKVSSVYQNTCGRERIILVGHSRGAATILTALSDLLRYHQDVRVDLVVTLGVIPYPTDRGPYDDNGYGAKRKNVKRFINIMSDRNQDKSSYLEWPIYGAEQYIIEGSTHTTVDNEFLDQARTKPNPAWDIVRNAIGIGGGD
jgi:hypothetical protein